MCFFFLWILFYRDKKEITFGARSDSCVDTNGVENDNFLFHQRFLGLSLLLDVLVTCMKVKMFFFESLARYNKICH